MENFTEIDSDRLGWECERQPALYHKYAKKLAEAKSSLVFHTSQVEVIKAEVSLDVRRNPMEYDIEKPTEAGISAVIPTTTKVQSATVKWLNAKHEVEILAAAVSALEHRKRMLTDMVQLFTMGYYAEPRVKSADREAIEESRKKRVRKQVGIKTRRPSQSKT